MANTMHVRCHNLERVNLDRENWALLNLRIKKEKMAAEELDRETLKQGQSTWEKILSQDQVRNSEKRLRRNALAENHLLQMKEKSLLDEEKKLEGKKQLEMFLYMDELHAQELRRQEEQKPLLKKLELEMRMEDISRVNFYREELAEIILAEKKKTRLASIELEEELLKRRKYAGSSDSDMIKRQILSTQHVVEKLLIMKKKEDDAAAEREEHSRAWCLAKIAAERVKLQKDAEKKAEALQSITAHRKKMIQEKLQGEEAERLSNADWLQVQKEADLSYLKGKKSMADRTRKENVQLQDFNHSLLAEKQQNQTERKLRRLDHGTARHTLGGGVSLSCGEGSHYITADITGSPLLTFGRVVKKQQRDCMRPRETTLANPDAVDVKVLTQMPPSPSPPPAELRKDSQRGIRARTLLNRLKDVSVNQSVEKSPVDKENEVMAELRIVKQKMDEAEDRRKAMKEVLTTCDRVLRQENEKNIQRNTMAGQQLRHKRERALQKAQEEKKQKNDLEMRRNMDRLQAQDLRWKDEENANAATFAGLARRKAAQREEDEGCSLGGSVNFSCTEGRGYMTADAAANTLAHIKRNKRTCRLPPIPNRYS